MTPAPQDWTVAIDDGLCHRHTACTLCGGREGQGSFAVWVAGPRAFAVLLCDRCRRADPQRLTGLLEARYTARGGHD